MKASIVPVGSLFVFKFKKVVKEVRKIYGYEDSSHYGKYRYRRAGLLRNIKYIKMNKGIIIRKDDSDMLKRAFIKNNISFKEYLIILHQKEAKKLDIKHLKGWSKIMNDLKGSKNLLVTVDF